MTYWESGVEELWISDVAGDQMENLRFHIGSGQGHPAFSFYCAHVEAEWRELG
jgi:hypothetical protein